MGLLDDAIREHLELRRRNGASEQEIAATQEEALGPARRTSTVEPPAPEEDVPASPAAEAFDRGEEDVEWESAPLDEYELSPPASDVGAEPAEDEDGGLPRMEDEPRERAPDGESEVEPRARDGESEVAGRPAAALDDESAHRDLDLADERLDLDPPEYDEGDRREMPDAVPESAEAPEQGREGPTWRALEPRAAQRRRSAGDEEEPSEPSRTEDVLEETPDFLEETPEHERLWFEQRPPRDFDFDE